MRRLAALVLVLLAGCGGDAPSSVVPADARVYVGVSEAEAERILRGISRDSEPDVQPWLGERAAYFVRRDEGGFVFDVEDEEGAEAFARKLTAEGSLTASAIVDGRLVLTSSRDLLRAAQAAADGRALADSTRLDVAGEDEGDAPEVLFATEDVGAFRSGLDAFYIGAEPALDLIAGGPLTVRVWKDLVEVKRLPAAGAAPSLADLPAYVRVAIAAADLSTGDPLARGREAAEPHRWPRELDLAPLLRHAGAGTMAVQGEGVQLGTPISAEVTDQEALRREVKALARELPRSRYSVGLDERDGRPLLLLASPRISELPGFLVEVGERLVIETDEALGGSAQELGDTRRYRDAARRLGGPPTMLTEDGAARNDGRGTLRILNGAAG